MTVPCYKIYSADCHNLCYPRYVLQFHTKFLFIICMLCYLFSADVLTFAVSLDTCENGESHERIKEDDVRQSDKLVPDDQLIVSFHEGF